MTVTPYTPTPFAVPTANPAIGAPGVAYPYCSPSEFLAWPTALDTSQLVPGGGPLDQLRALADVMSAASADIDDVCFGLDAASKGASLVATLSIESAAVKVIQGQLRLVCDYKPIIQVNAVDIGFAMSNLASIGAALAGEITFGVRTIYVPLGTAAIFSPILGALSAPAPTSNGTVMQVVWSYVNGYPHTELAANVTAGATTVEVLPTDGGTGLLGIVPNVTRLTIRDGANTESFTVSGVSGTTLTSATPLQYAHAVPEQPDFLPVTAMPNAIKTSCIYTAMYLIKTRGDNALMLQEISEPQKMSKYPGDEFSDLTYARDLLTPYRIRSKGHN